MKVKKKSDKGIEYLFLFRGFQDYFKFQSDG